MESNPKERENELDGITFGEMQRKTCERSNPKERENELHGITIEHSEVAK